MKTHAIDTEVLIAIDTQHKYIHVRTHSPGRIVLIEKEISLGTARVVTSLTSTSSSSRRYLLVLGV